jgi:fumarylacetoacetate (FAA) hydrolase family protein
MRDFNHSPDHILPDDWSDAALAGRVWRPDLGGPSVVAVRQQGFVDISREFPTMRDLCEASDPAAALRKAQGETIGDIGEVLANTPPERRDPAKPWLLAPIDLQAIKAAGVTFAISMLERVIEERARGNPAAAHAIRSEITRLVGEDFAKLKPGSPEAMHLKEVLIAQGAWSQYLEVGIGPDAEIFTKAQPMSAVGTLVDAGIHPISVWNNPEPEVVLAVNSRAEIVGATLGNDVNLRDVEGRSALLLSKAKDNNASCAIGPFLRFFEPAYTPEVYGYTPTKVVIGGRAYVVEATARDNSSSSPMPAPKRLYDKGFSLDDVRRMTVTLLVEGEDRFRLEGSSSIAKISRDPADLVGQMLNRNHQFPDGAVLFLGTLFAPSEDRDAPGKGFTHKLGDIVTIAAPRLGRLANRIRHSDQCEPWSFGVAALMRNLAKRGILGQLEHGSAILPPPASSASRNNERTDADRKSHVRMLIGSHWHPVPVEEALGTAGEKRCPVCDKPVRIHRASTNGMRIHFEHHPGNPLCELSHRRSRSK